MIDNLSTQGQPSTQMPSVANAITVASQQSREQIMYPDDGPNKDAETEGKPEATVRPQQPAEPPEKSPTPDTQKSDPNAAAVDDYQLEMPEGVDIDQALLKAAAPVLKDIGLSNEHANKLVPLVTEVQARFQQTQLDQLSALTKSWAKEAKAAADIGGKNWTETSRLAGVAFKAGGGAAVVREVKQLLDESGLGNHPAMIRLFRNIGAEVERLGRSEGRSAGTWVTANQRHQRLVYPADPPRK